MLTTRDGAAVEPGTPLYWLEPGTTRVYEAETWTRDAAMQRWSSPGAALRAASDVAERLCGVAMDDESDAHKRALRHIRFVRMCGVLLDAIEYTGSIDVDRVPPTDRPEAS